MPKWAFRDGLLSTLAVFLMTAALVIFYFSLERLGSRSLHIAAFTVAIASWGCLFFAYRNMEGWRRREEEEERVQNIKKLRV